MKALKKVNVSEILPYEKNPRKNDKAVDAVMESIKECGYCSPIIADENMVILAGHTRLKAIQKLGWDECEVLVVDGLTEEQKKKYRLFDNKTSELAEWDTYLLKQEMEGLDFSAFDVDWGLPEENPVEREMEFFNIEYDDDEFSDDSFEYECEDCGFLFNV